MAAHTPEQFATFMSQLKVTNRTLDFYSDFKKISTSVNMIEIHLNALNYLLNKQDLEQAVRDLWDANPKAFKVLDILIAVRSSAKCPCLYKEIDSWDCHSTRELIKNPEGIMQFLNETGLADVFKNGKITNLVDYVFGIETGLDSNARKNRSGVLMESLVAEIFKANGIVAYPQVNSKKISSDLSIALGKDNKVFDFMINAKGMTYLVEVNFFCGGGSKLNEVARSFTRVATSINNVPGFKFVWITDGVGWHSAKNKLQEAYNIIPNVYNLTNIQEFITILQ